MNVRHHPLHSTWRTMWRRCTKPNAKQWEDYGGRGIKVCERWADFWAFVADMGERPDGCTLERIDNDEDYTPENCKWATRSEQLRNRRNTVRVTIEGVTYKVIDLADEYGVDRRSIERRAKRGLSFADVVRKDRFRSNNVRPAIEARIKASRSRTHCKHGHEFTPENIFVTPAGARTCRECGRVAVRRARAKRRSKG